MLAVAAAAAAVVVATAATAVTTFEHKYRYYFHPEQDEANRRLLEDPVSDDSHVADRLRWRRSSSLVEIRWLQHRSVGVYNDDEEDEEGPSSMSSSGEEIVVIDDIGHFVGEARHDEWSMVRVRQAKIKQGRAHTLPCVFRTRQSRRRACRPCPPGRS